MTSVFQPSPFKSFKNHPAMAMESKNQQLRREEVVDLFIIFIVIILIFLGTSNQQLKSSKGKLSQNVSISECCHATCCSDWIYLSLDPASLQWGEGRCWLCLTHTVVNCQKKFSKLTALGSRLYKFSQCTWNTTFSRRKPASLLAT